MIIRYTLERFLAKWQPHIATAAFEDFRLDLTEMMLPPQPPWNAIHLEPSVDDRKRQPVVLVRLGKYEFPLETQHAHMVGAAFHRAAYSSEELANTALPFRDSS